MNVEERLIDTLSGDDDAWGQRAWSDPVGRVTTALRRRRRHRVGAGLTAAAAVAAVAAAGIMQWPVGNDAVVLPAGPPRQPAVTETPSPTPQELAAAAIAAVHAAQHAAAERAAEQGNRVVCPASPQPITSDMQDQAFAAVVSYNRQQVQGFDPSMLRRDHVTIASDDPHRGSQVTTNCRAFVATRAFVVYTTLTDIRPSASLAQGVYYVSRTDDAFRVWSPSAVPSNGTRVTISLWHCGVEPLRIGDTLWEVREPPFDATNAPASFSGSGSVVNDGSTLRYTDDKGAILTFTVDDGTSPPPCA